MACFSLKREFSKICFAKKGLCFKEKVKQRKLFNQTNYNFKNKNGKRTDSFCPFSFYKFMLMDLIIPLHILLQGGKKNPKSNFKKSY